MFRQCRVSFVCVQRSRLCAVGELTNCLPGTEAKLLTTAGNIGEAHMTQNPMLAADTVKL